MLVYQRVRLGMADQPIPTSPMYPDGARKGLQSSRALRAEMCCSLDRWHRRGSVAMGGLLPGTPNGQDMN